MTEADVGEMAAAVLTTPEDPVRVQEWRVATRASFLTQEQQRMAEWRMWRYIRDDARMAEAAKDLERIRGCLVFLAQDGEPASLPTS